MLFMLWLTVRLLTRLLVFLNDDDGTKVWVPKFRPWR
jgi:hypothetical protein